MDFELRHAVFPILPLRPQDEDPTRVYCDPEEQGSAFFISHDGVFLTAKHVVDKWSADSYSVIALDHWHKGNVYPSQGYWTAELRNVKPKGGGVWVTVQAIDLAFQDVLRFFYPNPADADGRGVTVGVIDTGSGSHHDLVIVGGACTVTGEPSSGFGDNGMQHGTHVAGIIGGRGAPGKEMRGIAPGVTLRAYRVFPTPTAQDPEPGADNFAIAKAIDLAISDGCDLINMSLGGGSADPATESAIHDARAAGVAVIVASGNDGKKQISFPAVDTLAVAVSALGRKGTVPAGTVEALDDIVAPFKTEQTCVAPFSNTGDGSRNIDLIGTGVGIISTVPGGYAVMSGTSMACPSVTGAAAKLLAASATTLGMPRNQARSDAIVRLLFAAARSMGFTVQQEGHGLLP